MAAEEASRTGEGLTVLHAVSKTLPPANAGGRTGIGHSREPDPRALISEAAGYLRSSRPHPGALSGTPCPRSAGIG
ncbi:hypothetical protein NG697_20735 [Pseudarthrobacter sp. MDT3-26]|nr:hypothetical protein [Pseudarthrobacter sp. MDT3-26]